MTTLIDLTKKAKVVLEKKQIFGEKAQIVIAVDVSGSMNHRFRSGLVQETITRLLAIGMNMDDNRSIDVFAFNTDSRYVGEASESNIDNYVTNVFLKKTSISGGTNYAPVMKDIIKKFGQSLTAGRGLKRFFAKATAEKKAEPATIPTFVFFITDGDNWDQTETEKVIREASQQGIFWQFVGIGSERFKFLQKLDDLDGRVVDNADFFHVNDIASISDDELYNRLLDEFPSWLKEARSKNILM